MKPSRHWAAKGTERTRIAPVSGAITIAYRRSAGNWLCTALQFDIVGVGPTRAAAFREMCELLTDYFDEILSSTGPVRFFNPSEAKEWNVRDQEQYTLAFLLSRKQAPAVSRLRLTNLRELRKVHHAIQEIDLIPAGA
ncbi:MAG: hypothetical protein HY706_22285 [Candidatus Hydrogenedentes bacterium]|nr:hypothetical protein [Candidatus Hydrogenedentota bacterium]